MTPLLLKNELFPTKIFGFVLCSVFSADTKALFKPFLTLSLSLCSTIKHVIYAYLSDTKDPILEL